MNSSHSVAHAALSLLSGVLFALGLALSQMVNPAKVLNFLDVAGDWDPTLAFVMGGALLITIPAFRLVLRRAHPLLETKFYLPTKLDIDVKLIAGAALFGIGWGIAGLCPGPAITAITTGMLPVVGFLLAMTAGVYLQKLMFPNNA
ncbi:conserved hypothetical protein; putative membrane protein [Stutzerimonas xanthomarina]|nr:conserved hypothetical protein; putative membrane protein [Stutzerimonas xanthomarina]